jgi:Holliday junction resolvase RusA-like endonuclease
MTDPVAFIVWTTPIAKGRPRLSKGRTYTPRRTKIYEAKVAEIARREMGQRPPFTGAVRLDITAYFAPPISWPEWKRTSACIGLIGPTGRPDIDNLAKAVSDALNGIVYQDDGQVIELRTKKRYVYRPCVKIKITPLDAHAANSVCREDVA